MSTYLKAHVKLPWLACAIFFIAAGFTFSDIKAQSPRLVVQNNVLQWSDGVPFKIVEANSPETSFAHLDYEWLDWLNAKGVNTIYATVNGKESGQVHVFPWKDENNLSLGFDDAKVNAWVAFAQYWVNLRNGRNVLHLLLSEKETHTLYTDAQRKSAMQYLVTKFQPVAGRIIWDREEFPSGNNAMVNDLYGYLKSIDGVNLRGMHCNTNENPWSGFYNSDLIQFLSFQNSVNSFDNHIRTEIPKNPNWAGYASEMTGGFQPNDVSKAETIFNAGAPYNSGAGVYIACCDQQDTHNHWYQAYEPVYSRLAQLAATPAPNTYNHVVVLILENRSYSEVIGTAPYLTSLANGGANFSNSNFITRPSQPNYLALFSGSTQGVTDNLNHGKFNAPNLARSLLDAGKTFVGYYEGLPSPGYEGDQSGSYVRRHNPSIQFSNIPLAQINQPFSAFPSNYNQLPSVAFVVPNNSHNMHDNSVTSGDTWINQNLSAYAQWAKNNNSLLIVTFDESSESVPDNRIPTIIYGAQITPAQYSHSINHYNVLRTIEEIFGLPYIANTASATNVWTTPRIIQGCTDPTATNYNPNATVDDGSCQYGTASILIRYSTSSNLSNSQNLNGVTLQPGSYYVFAEPQSLSTPVNFYLTKNGAAVSGFNPDSENSYPYQLNGGSYNFTAGNYSLRVTSGNLTSTANFTIGTGGAIPGCTDPAATNYNPGATVDDGSCQYSSSILIRYSTSANLNNSQSLNGATLQAGDYFVFAEPQSLNTPVNFYLSKNGTPVAGYNPKAESVYPYELNGGPPYNFTTGNYSLRVTSGNENTTANFTVGSGGGGGSVPGCTDPTATNYNPNATVDNGTCQYSSILIRYSSSSSLNNSQNLNGATLQSGNYYVFAQPQSLAPPVNFYLTKNGTAVSGFNPDSENSYPYQLNGGSYNFTTGNYSLRVTSGNESSTANFTVGSGGGGGGSVSGCTDPAATNYNPNATVSDGSCQYAPNNGIIVKYSYSPNHNNAITLTNGATMAEGNYYVFAEPQTLNTPVDFYLTKNGNAVSDINPHTEIAYPFDMNGSSNYSFQPGAYTLRVTSGSLSATFNFTAATGASKTETTDFYNINEAVPNEENTGILKVYPNPFSDELIIDFTAGEEETVELKIFNALGQLVSNEVIKTQQGENQKVIHFDESFVPGIYIIELLSGNRQETIKVYKSDQ